MHSTEQSILRRIRRKGEGHCFTPRAFTDLGSPGAVRVALHRIEKRGTIRRLSRGLYDFPRRHPAIGLLSPSPDEVARALSERDVSRLQPSGAYAANLLGLTEQVPARIVFLTDGPSRHVRIGPQEIVLKNTTTRNMATAGKASGTVIQALSHIGARHVNDRHVTHLREVLATGDKAQLRRDRGHAPGWMRRLIDAVAEDTHD